MYELNRVLLQSVGPKAARYEDVLLDFRDRDADPARGAILYLENGGGKSVLLKLLFSVLLPGRKYVLGADASAKTLENFVLTGDTAHVVVEWRRATAQGLALGELLLTGQGVRMARAPALADSRNLRSGGVVHVAPIRAPDARHAAYARGAIRLHVQAPVYLLQGATRRGQSGASGKRARVDRRSASVA